METIKELREAVRKYDREKVLALLKKKALKQIENEDERQKILSEIVSLRNMDIMKLLSKQQKVFSPKMFQMDMTSYANRAFLNRILSKYGRKFKLDDESVGKWMMKTACTVGNRKMVLAVLKAKNGYDYLPYLAKAQRNIFEAVQTVVADYVPPEVVIELLIQSAREEDGEERLKFLKKAGFLLETEDAKRRTATDLLELKLMQKAKNKKEMLEQKVYRAALRRIRTAQKAEKLAKKRKLLIILGILAAGIGAGYGIWVLVHGVIVFG